MRQTPAIIGMACLVCTLGCDKREQSAAPAPSAPPPSAGAQEPFYWFLSLKEEPLEVRRRTDAPVVKMLRKGPPDSPAAGMGDTVTIEFIARYVAADGTKTEFDSSARRGGPLAVPLQDGAAVIGLLRGLEGLRVGDVARIEIPADMGYGEGGRAPIPGNAGLEFEVWVTAIERD